MDEKNVNEEVKNQDTEQERVNEEANSQENKQENVEICDANDSQDTTGKGEDKKAKKNKYKEQIDVLEQQVAELKDQLLRNRAELENFKKRTNEELVRNRKYASMSLITDLLVYLDTLNVAVNMEAEDSALKNFLIGFKMINDQIFEVLKSDGLSEIKSLDMPFDPAIHQAVEKAKQEGVEPGMIIAVMQKGYMYKDRVLRPSMVKVSE